MKRLITIVLLMSALFLPGCSSEKHKPENQILKYNLPSEPKTLDPQISNDYSSNIILINIFEGLTRLDENQNIAPGVAKSWESLNNNTTFIFHLRENATWGNAENTPLTAKDFVFAFKRAVDKTTQSPYVSSLYCIKNAQKINTGKMPVSSLGVTAIDDYTLQIDLEYPNENFPKITSSIITMPCNEEFFNASAGQYGLELKYVLGNGPFKIKKNYGWDHFNSIHLVKNQNYTGETLPISAGISFDIGKEILNPIESIKNETVDAAPMNASDISIAQKEGMPLTSIEDTLWAICFNCSNKTYSNLNIRNSILSAFNRDYVLKKVPAECTVTDSLTINSLQVDGANFENIYGNNLYIKESSAAKSYLEKGLQELKLKELPTTSILCLDTPEVRAIVSNIIEHLNKNLNFNFNMTPMSYQELNSKVKAKDFQVAICPIALETDSALEYFNCFTTNNKANFLDLSDPSYDNLISQAYAAHNNVALTEILSKAELYLHENAVIYPLYKEKHYFASAKNVSQVVFHKYKKGIDFLYAKKNKK